MDLPDFYAPEMIDRQLPPDAEAAIGPTALAHRALLLNDILPRLFTALHSYDYSLRFGFYDFETNKQVRRAVTEIAGELDRADYFMLRSAFVKGEA